MTQELIHSKSLKKLNVDWKNTHPILPEQICSCSKAALTHNGYMTSYLQNTRQCTLHIERLWQHLNTEYLNRRILMLDQSQHCHVVAEIKIFLQAFSSELKKQIITSNIPFGRILDEADIAPIFKDRHFFTLSDVSLNDSVISYRQCCGKFFGRSHKMFNRDGGLLAEIWEVLP